MTDSPINSSGRDALGSPSLGMTELAVLLDETRSTADNMNDEGAITQEGTSTTTQDGTITHDGTIVPHGTSVMPEAELTKRPFLSFPLWLLYCIHGGFTMALPTAAIMYMINSHVQIPLSLLPMFGAVEFLPFAFKPLYAYLAQSTSTYDSTDWFAGRHIQLSFLLLLNAILFLIIPRVSKKDVVGFMLLGFLRGITSAWPEMLLGLSLIDEAHGAGVLGTVDDNNSNNTSTFGQSEREDAHKNQYQEAAARMQAQAATARNCGSVAAGIFGLLFFTQRVQLNLESASVLFGLSSLSSMASAITAFWFRVGSNHFPNTASARRTDERSEIGTEQFREELLLFSEDGNATSHQGEVPFCSGDINGHGREDFLLRTGHENDDDDNNNNNSNHNNCNQGETDSKRSCTMILSNREVLLVVALQVIVILLVLRQPVKSNTVASWVWNGVLGSSLLLVAVVVASGFISSTVFWNRRHGVALFLILRHVIPSAGIFVGSYRYSIFAESPLLLHILSLEGMIVLTGASWSFGRFFSEYSSQKLGWLIAGTTMLSALGLLSELLFIHASRTFESTWLLLGVASIAHCITSFTGEWSFLPEVVLATASLEPKPQSATEPHNTEIQRVLSAEQLQQNDSKAQNVQNDRGVLYGSYISCIDFGGQLGALVAGAFVSSLNITRENNWEHIDEYIVLLSVMAFGSLSLLVLLR